MILPKIRVLHSHGRQAIPDLDAVELTPEFRGRPCLTEPRDADDAEHAAAVCPTGAFTAAPLALDLGRCLFCGECARIAPRNVRFTNDYRIGSPTREGLVVRPGDPRIAFDAGKVRPEIRRCFSRALQLREVSAGGDAPASCAAVSQVELRTRQAEDEVGTLTTVNGGEFVSQTLAACPVGSQFYVRNLFYNVPARRKFLEKSTTSTGQIKSEFQRVALCNPQVGFELLMNDQPLYRLPAASLASRIVDVVGRHIKQNLLEVDADTSIVRVTGFVGRPAAAKKSNSSEQYLFVNGRYFRSPYFFKAILKAYEKLIPDACSPSYFLYLTIDPSRIDVNVHPQKTEVKFADEEAVWQIINAAVRETLAKTGAVPLMDFDQTDSVEIPVLTKGAVYREPKAMSNESYNPFRADYASDVSERMPDVDFSGFDAPYDGEMPAGKGVGAEDRYDEMIPSAGFAPTEMEFIPSAGEPVQQRLMDGPAACFSGVTVLGNGYASALYGGKWVVVDLRRARERVLYDNYLLLLTNGSSVSQQLLFPERLAFSENEYALLEENAVDFAALGFDLEFCGGGAVEVKGVPADIPHDTIDRLIYELLQEFAVPVDVQALRREKIAAVMACSGARSMSRTISTEEAESLLGQLCEGGNVSFTPSGKAVMAEITLEEIRNKLG